VNNEFQENGGFGPPFLFHPIGPQEGMMPGKFSVFRNLAPNTPFNRVSK